MYPFLGDVYFIFADRLHSSQYLPVEVGQADLVVIDQIKRADPGTGKCLHCISADSANTEHSNAAGSKIAHCFFSIKELCP